MRALYTLEYEAPHFVRGDKRRYARRRRHHSTGPLKI